MAVQERKVRYALVGAGNIAQVAVLPAFEHAAGNSELVAIVSSNAEKRAQLAARYGLEHVGPYDDFERLSQEAKADAVYLGVPNHLHREWTERAARAGLHILCEKPMATNVPDCHAMIAAAELAHVQLMIAYRLHFEEANLRAIEIARSGRIGEPRILSAMLTQQVRPGDVRMSAQAGGGALLDEGPYCVNASRYLFDAEP
jgi:predicted dehydrogenase